MAINSKPRMIHPIAIILLSAICPWMTLVLGLQALTRLIGLRGTAGLGSYSSGYWRPDC